MYLPCPCMVQLLAGIISWGESRKHYFLINLNDSCPAPWWKSGENGCFSSAVFKQQLAMFLAKFSLPLRQGPNLLLLSASFCDTFPGKRQVLWFWFWSLLGKPPIAGVSRQGAGQHRHTADLYMPMWGGLLIAPCKPPLTPHLNSRIY